MLACRLDPAFEKRKKKIRDEFLSAQTFEAVAREYIEQMMGKNGLAQATLVKANYFLEQLTPSIGNRPIHDIEPFEVLAPLKLLATFGDRMPCRIGGIARLLEIDLRVRADRKLLLDVADPVAESPQLAA